MEEREMTMREALNLALDQALASDERVMLLGEDIADPGLRPHQGFVHPLRGGPGARHPDLRSGHSEGPP